MTETRVRMATPAVVPVLRFRDGATMVRWLCDAFGFEQVSVTEHDGRIVHAELALGQAVVMGGDAGDPAEGGYAALAHPAGTAMLYVALDGDVWAHCERARAAGAQIALEPARTPYGAEEYTACDPEGNVWTFGTYVPELPAR